MTTQTFDLEKKDLGIVKELIGKSDTLIRYHSKVRTDFLGLEMKIMQERATIEQTMRDTVKGIVDDLGIENVESYEVDQDSGTLTLTLNEAPTPEPEVETNTEIDVETTVEPETESEAEATE